MTDWAKGAVIVAVVTIPLLISDTAANRLSSIWAWTKRQVWPPGTVCEQMQWTDIPPGKLHECLPNQFQCRHRIHSRVERCWELTMGVIFKRSWVSPTRQTKRPRKPEALEFDRRYLLTDAGTVLAAFICSAKLDDEYTRISCHENEIIYGENSIKVKEHQGIFVAHFTGQFQVQNSRLTKEDIDGILRGYPPFYREFISLKHGPKVPHPIQSTDDIPRAGWIVGAGLSEDPPFPFFIAANTWSAIDQFNKAMKRILDVLEQNIAEQFPDDDNVENVIRAVRYMINNQTESGVERYIPGAEVPGGEFNHLNGKQCAFAMRIFNNFTPLSDEDVVQLRPILAPVLNAAFQGVYTVMRYIKNGERDIVLPSLLKNRSRAIYLKDCVTGEL